MITGQLNEHPAAPMEARDDETTRDQYVAFHDKMYSDIDM